MKTLRCLLVTASVMSTFLKLSLVELCSLVTTVITVCDVSSGHFITVNFTLFFRTSYFPRFPFSRV